MSGLFPNLFHVARREYLVRVRGRAFVITTALLAVAVIGAHARADDPCRGRRRGPAGGRRRRRGRRPAGRSGDRSSRAHWRHPRAVAAISPPVVLEDDPEAAAEAVRDGDYDALLTITRDRRRGRRVRVPRQRQPDEPDPTAGQYGGTADRRRRSAEPGGRDTGPGLRDLRPAHLRRRCRSTRTTPGTRRTSAAPSSSPMPS